MGFFSSRKVDADVFDDKASVSRIIRSRFVRPPSMSARSHAHLMVRWQYGRNKGKAPEVPSASNSPARSAQPPLSASPRLPPKHLAPTYASDHAESAGRVSHPPQTPQSRPQNGQRNLNRASTDAVTSVIPHSAIVIEFVDI